MPVVLRRRPEGRRVEHHVVRDVTQPFPQRHQRVAHGPADGADIWRTGVVQVGVVDPGQHEHLVGRAAPERGDDDRALVVEHDAVAGRLLGLDCRAQQAVALEAGEAGHLDRDLAGHERHSQQLPVRMFDGRARFPAAVHDCLAVAQPGQRGVLLHPIPHRRHHQRRLAVVQIGPTGGVVRRQHQDLVDPAARRLGEDRPEMGHDHRRVAGEGGEKVGHHPHLPAAAGAVRLEGGRGRVLVAGAERAGPAGVAFNRQGTGHEGERTLGSVGAGDDPTPRQRVEPELAHFVRFVRRDRWVRVGGGG